MKKGGRMNKLRECRINKNITQEELSRISGISRTTIVNIEAGKLKFIRSDTMEMHYQKLLMFLFLHYFFNLKVKRALLSTKGAICEQFINTERRLR